MAYYLCRDYTAQTTNVSSTRTYISSYLLTIFLRRILGYTYVGDTNFPINNTGTLLLATGDTTPTVAPTFPAGNKAGIVNNGSVIEVSIPVAIRTVTSGDIGRILVLKSTSYPTRNSGMFVITAINTTGGVNRYVIDYRGNGDLAIPEAADTVMWWLYASDANSPSNGAGNGLGSSVYNSNGTSVTPRIILQSPHSLGWQVRICNESTADSPRNVFNAVCGPITVTPGFSGNAAGDFPIGGDNLSVNLYYNISGSTTNFDYCGGNGIGDDSAASNQVMRYTLIGDDGGQSVTMVMRRPGNLTGPRSFLATFGVPDNEPTPLPTRAIRRLYIISNSRGDSSNGVANDVSLQVSYENTNGCQGVAFYESPISCHPSMLAYVTNNNQGAGPMYDASAGDCPFTSSTELMPVDITAGMVGTWNGSPVQHILPFNPRTLGQLPIIKVGRGNFSEYSLTSDNSSWSVSAATNASPIQITTSTNHSLITGQSVAIHSVLGNTAANGTWVVTVTGANTFTLNGSTGNGAYTSGGTVLRGAQWQHLRRGIYIPWNGPAVVP